MRAMCGKTVVVMLVLALAAGCSRNSDPKLLNIAASNDSPDEFAIIPSKPLQQPDDFNALPAPTPGGANRVDPNPSADAIVALGGDPAAESQGIPAADAGLINHTSRYGVSGTIRQQLAAEDLEFRRRKDGRVLERLFNVNVYFRAYSKQALDQYAELERFRLLGVWTPAAPPDVEE